MYTNTAEERTLGGGGGETVRAANLSLTHFALGLWRGVSSCGGKIVAVLRIL